MSHIARSWNHASRSWGGLPADSVWVARATMWRTATLALVHSTAHSAAFLSGAATLSLARRTMEPRHLLHSELTCRSSANARQMPQIETPFRTCRTTTHQFIWQQQHTYGVLGGSPMECGVGGQPARLRIFIPDTGNHPSEWPSREQPGSGLTASAPLSDVSAPALQMGHDGAIAQW